MFITKRYIAFLIGLSLLASCKDNTDIIFEGPYHVRFTTPSSEVVENYSDPPNANFNPPDSVQIHLASPSLNNTTIVEYEVAGTAVENKDYVLLNNNKKQVLIPVGKFFGKIEFVPINNRENSGDKTIKFIITKVNNNLQIGLGVNGVNGKTHTVTIKDDDCLVNLKLFQGDWEFDQNDGQFTYDVKIKVDYSLNNRIVMYGYTGLDSTLYAFANLDLCSREFIIPEQYLGGAGNQAGFTRSDGKGTFDAEVKTLTFSYSFDAGGTTIRKVVATKKLN